MWRRVQVPIGGGQVVELMEIERGSSPEAEVTAMHLLRQVLSSAELLDWRRRRAIAVPYTETAAVTTIHVTPAYAIVETDGELKQWLPGGGQVRLGKLAVFCIGPREFEPWAIGDTVLALWMLAKFHPQTIFEKGALQYPFQPNFISPPRLVRVGPNKSALSLEGPLTLQ